MNYEEYVENLSMRDWCDEDEMEWCDEDEWRREDNWERFVDCSRV